MDAVEQSLKEHAWKVIDYVELVYKEIKSKHLQNRQWVLDFLDKLNEISVR